MDQTMRHRATIGVGATVVLFAALVLGQYPGERFAIVFSNVGQSVAPALAALACWWAGRRAGMASERAAWRFLAGSALAWSAGQVVWTYYEVSGVAAPYPSVADVGYLAAVPLALAGVWKLSTRSPTSTQLVAAVDGLILSGSLLAISWPLVLGPAWEAGGDSALTFALSLAYPVGSLVVGSSVLVVIMRSGRSRSAVPLVLIGAGLLTLGLADSVFVLTTLEGTEEQVSVADVGWLTGYLVLMLAALSYPREQGVELDADALALEHQSMSLRRAILPITVAGSALVIRAVMEVQGTVVDPFLAAVTIATVALGLLRHLMTVRENRDLTRSLGEKIHELERREEQLTHQAFHDPLTGLANRRLFGDRVEHALERSRRTGERTAVLFVDLDDFKVVNDSLGHAAGDRLLGAVGARLSGCVRPGDTVSRLGGDEFGVLLEELDDRDHPGQVADRILQALDVPFPVDGRQVFTRASIGVAVADPAQEPDGDQLLADADVALYAAKASGKATFRRFEGAMRVSAVERLELGQDLRRAIQAEEFVCHYQPIVDLVTGRIVAVEALVRWNHPTKGILAPGSFIDMAEDTGAIATIGRRVLQEAAAQAAEWRDGARSPGDLELHVNLSGRQLEDAGLVAEVARTLADTGFPARLLVLEITESVAVDIAEQHLERLVELRGLGVRLAIDDFGTGYSSLSYLRTLPVDVLKIDRTFAKTLGGATDQVLLEAIVKLGHSLGIEVVAEGIEREDQAAALRRMGCRRAQGFLFHRPLQPEHVPGLFTRPAVRM